MSTHTGVARAGRRARVGARASRPAVLPAVLYATTVLAQIAYPLAGGAGHASLTAGVVLLTAAAALTHAGATCGRRGVLALVAVAGTGLAAEAVGVATGVPFGRYAYAGTLGPEVAGVPWLVVAAWTGMAWPAALVAVRVARHPAARVAVASWALAAWDVFLDPQMVGAGHWTWAAGGWRLPGVPDVPVANFAGWLLVSTVISAVLLGVSGLFRGTVRAGAARPPVVFYVWTAASSALAAGAFWGRPAVAFWGLVVMGPVAVAAARTLRRP